MTLNRRSLLKGTAAVSAAVLGADLVTWAKAWAATDMRYTPESGAKLELLRWKRFVQSEEESFIKLVDAFTAACRAEYGLTVSGLMCIPPVGAPPAPHFTRLAALARRLELPLLSMGMSADYEIAVRLGATHVRVGTAIFGPRPVSVGTP